MRSRPHRPLRARAATVVPLAVILLSSAGCSGGEQPDGQAGPAPAASPSGPSTTTSGSPSAAPSASPASLPSRPAPRRGPAGQKAFARYVMALWGTSLRNDDARPLLALAPRGGSCAGCPGLAAELRTRSREGWYVDFPGLLVRRLAVAGGPAETVARARVDVPASDTYFSDGRYRSSNAAHPGATFTVRMRWVEGRYRLLGFTVA